MSITVAALIGSFVVSFSCLVAWKVLGIKKVSKPAFFVGTMVLVGCVLFELVPEMMELGGMSSAIVLAASWACFTGLQKILGCCAVDGPQCSDIKDPNGTKKSRAIGMVVGMMSLQCFAGGVMLVSSSEVVEHFAWGLFLGLLLHKAIETFSVASILTGGARTREGVIVGLAVYVFSFPAGVLLAELGTAVFKESLTGESMERAAAIVVSLASGSLLACLFQNFLLPNLRAMRSVVLRSSESA